MTPSISIADSSFDQIRDLAVGPHGVEVEVQQHAGAKFVLMTVEGYEQLRRLAYDDSDLTPDEMLAAASWAIADSDGWDAEGMSDYDQTDATTPNT
jgi:hypothetical protein